MTPRCLRCGGAWHFATGAAYQGDAALICGPCEREFWKWVRRHTAVAKRVGPREETPARFVYFYEHTGQGDDE